MFEVITQTQPQDYQSLEILKEAYSKLNRYEDFISTSKRIAHAYVLQGQLSSAILEYESILQQRPDDPDALAALGEIAAKATGFTAPAAEDFEPKPADHMPNAAHGRDQKAVPVVAETDDGREELYRIFVESKAITPGDFDLCWREPDLNGPAGTILEPFVQRLADKNLLPIDSSLKLISGRGQAPYLPLDRYDVDLDLARTFPAEICQRWCILPFDRMSKTVFVATTNPFNLAAAAELSQATRQRLLWFVASPAEIIKSLRKAFR
jgi:hypothetical protein